MINKVPTKKRVTPHSSKASRPPRIFENKLTTVVWCRSISNPKRNRKMPKTVKTEFVIDAFLKLIPLPKHDALYSRIVNDNK